MEVALLLALLTQHSPDGKAYVHKRFANLTLSDGMVWFDVDRHSAWTALQALPMRCAPGRLLSPSLSRTRKSLSRSTP